MNLTRNPRNELLSALSALFDDLVEKNLMPANADKNDLIETVADNILEKGEIPTDALKNNFNVAKALQVSLVAQFVADKNPACAFDYTKLFDKTSLNSLDEKMQAKDDLKLELEGILKNLVAGLSPEQQKKLQPQMGAIAATLSDDLIEKNAEESTRDPDNDCLAKNANTVDLFAEITASLASLNGGVDPDKPGNVSTVSIVMGNLEGFATKTEQAGEPLTFMLEQDAAQPGKPDYGNKAVVITNAISNTDAEGLLDVLAATVTRAATMSNQPGGH